ncbi:MAG TPA: glycosyltransferase 87 family protein [Myxococcota bacterium]|nr:glycosyltransferase 87 family protein [Myxococcota bacterium]
MSRVISRESVVALLCVVAAGVVVSLGELRESTSLFLIVALAWAGLASLGAVWARDLRLVLAAGVVLRLLLVASPPTLSDDIYRYLWEGRIQLAGFDPFLYPPSDPALTELRNGTWEQVAHKDVSTIYPPLALWLFRAVAFVEESVTAWKLVAAGADIGLMFALWRECRARGIGAWAPALYALHPLPVLESAGSGHLESIALLFFVLGLRRRSSFLVGVAALVKVLPAVAWVTQARDKRALLGIAGAVALGGLLCLPFVDAGPTLLRGFDTYAERWEFNGALFPLLVRLFGEHARYVGVGIGALYCLYAAWRLKDPAALLMHVAAALVLLSPVVHPWYVLWILVPALLRGAWAWVLLASTTLLSYAVLIGYDPALAGSWEEPAWVVWLEYPPVLLLLGWSELRKRRSKLSPEG